MSFGRLSWDPKRLSRLNSLPIGLATTPGNSVSIATKLNFWMIWQIVLNSDSKLCAQTSRMPHSSLVMDPGSVPPIPDPFIAIWTTGVGVMIGSGGQPSVASGLDWLV